MRLDLICCKVFAAVFAYAAFAVLLGQAAAADSFEVASVKLAAPSGTRGARVSVTPDRVSYRNTTLKNVLARAFEVSFGGQIVGPSWISTERYDIIAKLPDGVPKEKIPLMLRSLLVDRFHLVFHEETREFRTYTLVRGAGRLKVHPDDDVNVVKDSFSVKDGRREARRMTMTGLARFLSLVLRTTVSDRTATEGTYEFPIELSMEELGGPSASPAPDSQSSDVRNNPGSQEARSVAPSIFTLVRSLGLNLDAQKTAFRVIVINSGNKVPAKN